MSKKVVFSEDAQLAVLKEHGLIVAMSDPVVAPRSPKVVETAGGGSSSEVSPWGDSNDFPQQIIQLAEKSTELPALLDWKARALQGLDVLPYQLVYYPDTKTVKEELVWDEEILDFLEQETFKRYLREASNDFFWFWNVFPELIKSAEGDKIAYIGTQDASWCRWGKMNDQGIIDKCFVASNWPDAKPTDKTTVPIDVIDPYQPLLVDSVKAKNNLKRFIYPISYPSPGKAYYQLAPWDGYRTSKWSEIAANIPVWKVKAMAHQFGVAKIVKIPHNYWKTIYPNWLTMKPEERKKIKQDKAIELNTQLTGVDAANKTIICDVGVDDDGKELKTWEIVPIQQAFPEGTYLEDSQEASAHLMRALSLDPTLVGEGPGKKMGSGSGSDKRVAFNIYVALQRPYRDVILEPLNFIARYNGWKDKYKRLRFKFTEISIETLDKSHQTSQEVVK